MEEIGWLSMVDLSLPLSEQKPLRIKANYPEHFRPHGISYAKVNGKDTLAVISHTLLDETPHRIEIFEHLEGIEWKHTKTLEHPLLTGPNDLFLTESGEIFSSNDRGPENKLMQYVNMIIKRGTADLVYYNGKEFKNLDHKVILGNGVFYRVEKGEEILYRSVFSEKSIHVFKINRTNEGMSLEFRKKIEIGSGPDNIMQDPSGDLYVVGHPSVYSFLKHASSKSMISPSIVYRINQGTDKVDLVYSNDGSEISAASTAYEFGKRIYISQVFEDFLLTCEKP
ncbi:putative arylesterase [Leptospira ryugenii]|uniref:Putative arylesterase n=2 Tax=Leptospira ryugenii TaxID=1917863 RepID=A0A2P2E3I3_9LEPT|nr:putative arylesterase [Leptospira ryugenii]